MNDALGPISRRQGRHVACPASVRAEGFVIPVLHAGAGRQSPGLGSCTWEWPGQLQPHTSGQAVSAAAGQQPLLVTSCVTAPSCLLASSRQASRAQLASAAHMAHTCASTQVDGQCCYILLWRVRVAGSTQATLLPLQTTTPFRLLYPPGSLLWAPSHLRQGQHQVRRLEHWGFRGCNCVG